MEVLPEDILTKPLNNFGSSARRSGRHKRVVVGVLLAFTASLAAARPAGLATASVAPLSDDFSRKQRKLTGGYVMTDSTIRTAVKAWLADATAAEATYGHISTWETGGVTNMAYLFCNSANSDDITLGCNTAAASFNDDISAWDTSGAKTMYQMFYQASSFNQPLGDWQIDTVTSMYRAFYGVSAFDQDLGWCVGVDLDQSDAFSNTACASSLCGVSIRAVVRCGSVMDDWVFRTAVAAWLSNSASAEAMYGHISTWETGRITDMSYLFCGDSGSIIGASNCDCSCYWNGYACEHKSESDHPRCVGRYDAQTYPEYIVRFRQSGWDPDNPKPHPKPGLPAHPNYRPNVLQIPSP